MLLIKATKTLESWVSTSQIRRHGFVSDDFESVAALHHLAEVSPTGHRMWASQSAPSQFAVGTTRRCSKRAVAARFFTKTGGGRRRWPKHTKFSSNVPLCDLWDWGHPRLDMF